MYLLSMLDNNDWIAVSGYILLAVLAAYFVIQIIVGYKKGGKK